MLSVETENKLAKLLLTFADGESSVEVSRQVLNNQIGFDPYQLFKLLDLESKGYIDSVNLVDFFRRHSIFASSVETQQIIYHYDADLSATLNYSEFLNLLVSERNSLFRSGPNFYKTYDPVPYDVEFSLVRLLEKELDLVKALSLAIRDLNLRYDFNVIDAFRSLDILGIDNINTESIRKYLIRNFISPSEQDVMNIVKRLDVDRDYRVTFTEFKNLFSSYSAGYTSTPSTLLYSPLRRTVYSPVKTKLYCSPRKCYSPLRSYYSPVRTRTIYSPLRNSPRLTAQVNVSPLKTRTNEILSRSPKRVDSPERVKSSIEINSNNISYGASTGFNSFSSKYANFAPYEEEVFINYIREMIILENNIESNKNEVSLKSDFNMEDVFRIFEKYNKGYISEYDFKDGLNSYFGLFPLSDEISTLYKRYDTEKNSSLR